MARDLARAQQAETQKTVAERPKAPVLDIAKKPTPQKPVPPPIPPRPIPLKPPTPPQLPISPKPLITPDQPTTPAPKPRSLSDILDDARKRAEQPATPPIESVPLPIKPTAPQIEDLLPIEIEPPDNLPTGDEKTPAPKVPLPRPSEALGEGGPRPIPPTPSAQAPISTPKTPEEILGLPAKSKPSEKLVRDAGAPIPADTPAKPTAKKLEALPGPKFAIIGGVLGIITAVVLGVLVWKIFIQEPPPPLPPPPKPTGPIEQPMPQPLIRYDQVETLAINKLNYDSLKPLLDAPRLSEPVPGSLIYVPIKLSGDKEIRYLTLAEFLTTLQIDAPPTFADYKDYTLFLYNQKNSAAETCAQAKVTSELCFSPRLGLVIKLPDASTATSTPPQEIALRAMREWEKTLAEDLRPLMLFAPRTSDSTRFELGKHESFDTHYINLPIHTMSIDWIVTKKHLIIATSKDAARAAVGRLIE